MTIFVIFTIFVIVLCYLRYWRNRRFSKVVARFKQNVLRSYPILGISYLFFGNNESNLNSIQLMGRLVNEHNGLAGDWFGPRFYLMVTDPVMVEFFLKTCLEKDDVYKLVGDELGNGSFVAPVPIWRHRRKNLNPLFSPKSLNRIVPIFIRSSSILVECLKPKAGKKAFQMWEYLATCNVDSICESVLEVQLNTQKNPDQPFLKAFREGLKLTLERMIKPWLHINLLYKCLPQSRKFTQAVKESFKFINKIIELKRMEVQNNEQHMKSFLEQLMETAGYNDKELLEESMVLILAATDTSAASAGFTMLMLARYPEIQDKVYEELQEVFGDSDRPLISEDLQRLKYLEIVIKESMRLYSPSVAVLRKVSKDVILPSGETVVEGCGILVNIWTLHRNRAYWGEDADQFHPERFLKPMKHPAQYMPFSTGPRNCPGYQYSLLNLKTILASLLRKYRVLPPDDHQFKPIRCTLEITLKDADGFVVRLESRN